MTKNCCLIIIAFLLLPISNAASESSAEKIKIGVSLSLSGAGAEWGIASKNGFELALSEAPNDYKKFIFIYEDNKYDATTSISVFKKLHSVDKVDFIYSFGETVAVAFAPLAEQAKVPVIAMSQDPTPTHGRKYIIRNINYSEQYSKKLLEYLRVKGYKRFGILETVDSYHEQLLDGFTKELARDEKIIFHDKFDEHVTDFKSTISKLKGFKLDALGVYLFPGQVSQFYIQSDNLGYKIPAFGSEIIGSRAEIKEAKGLMEGTVYAGHPVNASFREKYIKKYDNDFGIAYAGLAYDFMHLIRDLFKDLDKSLLSADKILELFSNINPREGVLGKYAFKNDEKGGKYYEYPLAIKEVSGSGTNVIYK